MRAVLTVSAMLAVFPGLVAPALAQTIGIVLQQRTGIRRMSVKIGERRLSQNAWVAK